MSIVVERDNGLVTVTFASPERRNALTPDEFEQFREILTQIARSKDDRAVLLTGEGSAFCAGAFLPDDLPDESTHSLMARINDAARALHRLPQPIVAAVNGPAFGAGMSIALACDLVVASTKATFCQVFVKRALVPDFGSSWLLPRAVGMRTAKRLALTGEVVGAEEALRLGIATEIADADQLVGTAAAVARELAAGPPLAMALTKRLIESSYTTSFDDALDAEAAFATVAAGTEDVKEAFAAFADKRPALFTGR